MTDNEADSELGHLEPLALRQKTEKKDLQAKIQALKKGIPKGDKKKNKEVKAQIAILESELSEKHDKEIKELNDRNENYVTMKTESPSILYSNGEPSENLPQRVSKAMKKREKKAQKEKQQAEIAAKVEEDYINTQRYAEEQKISKLLAELKLEVKPMVSDGNCLYYAIEDQVKSISRESSYSSNELRKFTSDFMASHADDFMPFLTNPNTGDCLTSEEFEKYCSDVAETSAWGGQLELRAMSCVLQKPIHVIQADVPTVKIGEEYQGPPIVLTYHRHELGLGEHYNSVAPLKEGLGEDS